MTLAARYELYKTWCVGMRLEHGIATAEKWEKTQAKLPTDYSITNADFILMNGKTKRRRRDTRRNSRQSQILRSPARY